MAATVIEDHKWHNCEGIYSDRKEAGRVLASFLKPHCEDDALVLAIPSGGVPVGLEISNILGIHFDLIIIRKIPIPGNTEAGFGAISLEGDIVLDSFWVQRLGLEKDEIDKLIEPVVREIDKRNQLFRSQRPFPSLAEKTVILVDDGLASGYTMGVAAEVVSRKKPAKIIIAVPTAPASTIEKLGDRVDMIICPNIREGFSFAVASAYRQWYDLDRSEVLELLKSAPWIET
jgi:predicted phosphoribosyltransferase